MDTEKGYQVEDVEVEGQIGIGGETWCYDQEDVERDYQVGIDGGNVEGDY